MREADYDFLMRMCSVYAPVRFYAGNGPGLAVAGAFLAFLQQPENLEKLYQATGNFPASSNWDPSTVTSPTDQLMLEWLGEKNTAWWAANYTPGISERRSGTMTRSTVPSGFSKILRSGRSRSSGSRSSRPRLATA